MEGTIEAGCDSDAALKSIKKWLNKKHATMEMLGGANTDLLRDIRAIKCWLPELEVNRIKVKAHQKRNAKSFRKVINDEMDTLSNTVHTCQGCKARNTAQHFASSLTKKNESI